MEKVAGARQRLLTFPQTSHSCHTTKPPAARAAVKYHILTSTKYKYPVISPTCLPWFEFRLQSIEDVPKWPFRSSKPGLDSFYIPVLFVDKTPQEDTLTGKQHWYFAILSLF